MSTDPAALLAQPDPVGPENDFHILDAAHRASMVICAWGRDGLLQGRGAAVTKTLQDAGIQLHCLKITPKTGQPQHPLYLSYDIKPIPYPNAI